MLPEYVLYNILCPQKGRTGETNPNVIYDTLASMAASDTNSVQDADPEEGKGTEQQKDNFDTSTALRENEDCEEDTHHASKPATAHFGAGFKRNKI